jgi:hypothetical protein
MCRAEGGVATRNENPPDEVIIERVMVSETPAASGRGVRVWRARR